MDPHHLHRHHHPDIVILLIIPNLERAIEGEKSIFFASARETELREEKIGASAGLSLDLKLVRDQKLLAKQIINQNKC